MYCDLWLQYINVRKLFKGGNYSRAETIWGNTVYYFSLSQCATSRYFGEILQKNFQLRKANWIDNRNTMIVVLRSQSSKQKIERNVIGKCRKNNLLRPHYQNGNYFFVIAHRCRDLLYQTFNIVVVILIWYFSHNILPTLHNMIFFSVALEGRSLIKKLKLISG